jgi:hypothetical protein
MTVICPICKSAAHRLDSTGDATGYACATHGGFHVAGSVFAEYRAEDTPTMGRCAAQSKTESEGGMARYN